MQKFFFTMVVAVSGLFLLNACQQEIQDPNGTQNAVTGDFRAKIDGTQWVANSAASGSRMNGRIAILGRSNDRKYLAISLTDSGVHNYILDDMTLNAASYIDSSLPNPINLTTNQGVNPGDAGGTVRITSIDTTNKKISGTFSFKVFRQTDGLQKTFTEGSFTNLSYTTTLAPTNTNDTFKVKIAGTSWIPHSVVGVVNPAVGPLPAKIAIVANNATATQNVSVIMPATITPGTYTLDFFGGTYIGTYAPDTDPSHSQASVSGELVIISHNPTTKRIRGTFRFRAEELINPAAFTEITEGYFAITYL
jgi:hypothetical protein